MKYIIHTSGCQMNQHDSEFIESMLRNLGGTPTKEPYDADVIVINTCSVRETAENKINGFINSLKAVKEHNPSLKIVVCGCMVSKKDKVERLLNRRPYIDIILGTRSLDRLPYYLQRAEEEKGPFTDFNLDKDIPEGRTHIREKDFRAYLTIMYGCDNFCSYCIVPYVRGREISRKPDDIIKEAEELVASGAKEIMLLGQNVNSYGKSLGKKDAFSQLLYGLNDINGLERIRYMTSHPKDFSSATIQAIADCDKVCKHFHLPFQAGSDAILKAMNRHYTKEYYLSMMDEINERFPDAVLTTDIIVGFPGETDADFEQTIDILKHVRYDNAYTFLYSPRRGTPASERNDFIPDDIKKQRFNYLMKVQNQISLEKNNKMLGREYTVLGEGKSKNNPLMETGRTEGNKLIHFAATESMEGKLCRVRVEECHTWSLNGKLV